MLLSACALALGIDGSKARAHQQSATFGQVSRTDVGGATEIAWRLRVRAVDLASALGGPPSAPDGAVAIEWRARARTYLQAGLKVFADAAPCAGRDVTLESDPREREATFAFGEVFVCRADARALRLRYDLFFEADRFHQSFTLMGPELAGNERPAAAFSTARSSSPSSVVFRNDAREASLGRGAEESVGRNMLQYLKLGVTHILTGYDHLSFLMALLLASGLQRRKTATAPAVAASPRQAVTGTIRLISAFTIAHSLTLIVQVLWPGWISTRWVEPAIAFSVAYVGFENLVPRQPRHRFWLVFGFGLVHGLGFASVLNEIGLPRRGVVLSLLSFNLGVELGQLMVLSLAFPLIVGAARRNPRRFERWGLQVGSGLIAAFGSIWLARRLAAP